uniref:Ribosome assembly factor mrt4 n=1 Tax=Saccoglossus kowalevskii TaxID=10224 RepID=A0ABM0GII0_SACKO|nr:PREDICTED: mRNA turnover protein 4 homolog [Saccoglossus kowalevskii]
MTNVVFDARCIIFFIFHFFRFFLGKNKVMSLAFGRRPENEYRENLHRLSKRLAGNVGILFTNKTKDETIKWFEGYSFADHPRSGNKAAYTVTLDEGPLEQFPHSMEPHLRQLGLPTTLKKGIVTLLSEHTVCKAGHNLTPEQARILKLLDHKMSKFSIKLECMWSNDGTFENLSVKNKKPVKHESDGEEEVEDEEEDGTNDDDMS